MSLPKRIARPIYRRFFEQPLWWFLAKVKVFFMAEITERVSAIENRLHHLEHRINASEAATVAQWDALEQLVLAMLAQPDPRLPPSLEHTNTDNAATLPVTSEVNRVNGPQNLH